jgi:putative ABC transport system ATP-binding protein
LNDQGITVVMVTHELDIAQFARRTIIMRDGQVVNDRKIEDRHSASEEIKKLEMEQQTVKLLV